MDGLDCMSNVILDGVKFLLHVTGPYKMYISFLQTALAVGFLGQIGNERRQKVHCSKQALDFLLVFWRSKRCDTSHFLRTQLDTLRCGDASEVLDLLFLNETLVWVEL